MAKWNTMAKFALTALLVASAPVLAEEPIKPEQRPAVCASVANYARIVMTGRQKGLPASQYLDGIEAKTPPMREFIQRVTVAAWQVPQFNTLEYQQRAVTEFQSQWQVQCLAGKVFSWGEP